MLEVENQCKAPISIGVIFPYHNYYKVRGNFSTSALTILISLYSHVIYRAEVEKVF